MDPDRTEIERVERAPRADGSKAHQSATRPQALLDVSAWDQQDAVRAAANRELHADLLELTVNRLRSISLVTAVVLSFYLFGAWLYARSNAGADAVELWRHALGTLTPAVIASVGLCALARLKAARPRVVAAAGYLYLIVLSLLLAWLRYSPLATSLDFARQVSPAVIPILVFGALIPTPPRKALLLYLGCALVDPTVLFLLHSKHDVPGAHVLIYLASPLIAAFIAYRMAESVHRLNEGIVKAREVGSYRLVERLGVGGMAEVWRADHHMLARPAAVKLIRPKVLIEHGPLDAERLLRLFLREARITASLRSPHTIQLYDFGVTREGAFYYVMELLDGLDLQTLVERFGPQPAARVATLLIQVCHSLREAHERNFVHRDIKPANIFACRFGGDVDFVKVLDFGLVLDRHPTSEELEDEKQFVGTPAVMAPEMVRFQAPVDARADIYALGCVGYWLLTGKRVFEAQTRADMLVMHAHQKPVTPTKRSGNLIDARVEAVIMACLEKNPNKRPQTARELSESLAAIDFAEPWSLERAELWWKKNSPRREAPNAD